MVFVPGSIRLKYVKTQGLLYVFFLPHVGIWSPMFGNSDCWHQRKWWEMKFSSSYNFSEILDLCILLDCQISIYVILKHHYAVLWRWRIVNRNRDLYCKKWPMEFANTINQVSPPVCQRCTGCWEVELAWPPCSQLAGSVQQPWCFSWELICHSPPTNIKLI